MTDVSATQLNGVACTRISIFLNVFDVHVNRAPISGVIKSAVYKKGQFRNAMDSTSAADNEQNIVTVEGEGMTVVFKQIAGLLARRIVFNHKPGHAIIRGQRVGMIKFGSRGVVSFELRCRHASRDVHSGNFVAPNPAWKLNGLLASMATSDGVPRSR